jgi:hypothetical protein
MTTPDPRSGLMQLEEMITSDLHEHIDPANRGAIIGWGLFFTVVHQVHALEALHNTNTCSSASPIRRSAIEHTLTLRWCADEGDRFGDIYNRKLRNDQIQLAKALRAAGSVERYADQYKVMEETVRTVNETVPPDPNERLAKIEHLLDGYRLTGEKSLYHAESRFTHPTPTGVQQFFTSNEEAFVLSQLPIHEEMVDCRIFSLWILHTAMLGFNELLNEKPWSEELRSIAEEFDLSTRLPQWRGSERLGPRKFHQG